MKLYISFFITIMTAHAILVGAEKPESYRDRIGGYFKRARGEKPTKATVDTPAVKTKKSEIPKIAPMAPVDATPAEAKKELAKPVILPMDCGKLRAIDCSAHLTDCQNIKKKTQDEKNEQLRKLLTNYDISQLIKRCAIAATICAGADPNINVHLFEQWSMNALAFGVAASDHAFVRFLFEANIDPNLPGLYSTAAIFEVRDIRMLRLFLEYGARVDIPDRKMSLLHHLAEGYKVSAPEALKVVLDAGLDPDTRGYDNNTPLHLLGRHCSAYYHNDVERKARYLLDAGATADSKNTDGKTAIDLAQEQLKIEQTTPFDEQCVDEEKEYRKKAIERCQCFILLLRTAELEQRKKRKGA